MSRALAKASAQVCLVESRDATTAPATVRIAPAEQRRANIPTVALIPRQQLPAWRPTAPAGAAKARTAQPTGEAGPQRQHHIINYIDLILRTDITGVNRMQQPEGHMDSKGYGTVQDMTSLEGLILTGMMYSLSGLYQLGLACLHTVLWRRKGGPVEIMTQLSMVRGTCMIGIRAVHHLL